MTTTTTATPPQTFDHASMALRGRLGGLTTHARHSSDELLAPARRGFYARFERQARDEATAAGETDLAEAEIARRAQCLFRAHMARLALASHSARKARSQAQQPKA